jgi:hypothetical protein
VAEINTKELADAQIKILIAEAHEKIKSAEALADKFGIEFGWDLAYGMGGHYYPTPGDWSGSNDEWRPSGVEDGGWRSSSQSC